MRNFLLIVLLLSIVLLSLTVFGDIYAVVIGVGAYADKSIIPLPGAVKDAKVFKNALINLKLAREENVKYLENPTLAEVKRYMTLWAERSKSPSDILIIYYSGHGYSKDGKTYLISADTYSDYIEDTALNFTDFLKKLNQIKKGKMMIIMDSCYAGSIRKDRPLKMKRYESTSMEELKSKVAFMLSSEGNEVSHERPEGGGWFTYYLIDGMYGKADINNDNDVDIKELFDYIRKNVERKTDYTQHPVLIASADLLSLKLGINFNYYVQKTLGVMLKKKEPKNLIETVERLKKQNPLMDDEYDREMRKALVDLNVGSINYEEFKQQLIKINQERSKGKGSVFGAGAEGGVILGEEFYYLEANVRAWFFEFVYGSLISKYGRFFDYFGIQGTFTYKFVSLKAGVLYGYNTKSVGESTFIPAAKIGFVFFNHIGLNVGVYYLYKQKQFLYTTGASLVF